MARKSKTATEPQNTTLDRAHTIAEKVGDQIRTLIGRNWRDIQDRIEDETGEVKISFGVTITDRQAEEGTHASKDNRIATTISFAKKFSDKIESEIPDSNQPELPVNGIDTEPVVE